MHFLRKGVLGQCCSLLLSVLLLQQLFAFSLLPASLLSHQTRPDPVQTLLIRVVEWATHTSSSSTPCEPAEERTHNTGGTEEERQEGETQLLKIITSAHPLFPMAGMRAYHLYDLPSIPGACCTLFTPPPEHC